MKRSSIKKIFIKFSLFIGLFALVGSAFAAGSVHWGYEGEEGPEHWGDLSEEYAVCSTGTEQSPIDIPSSALVNPADIVFNYQPSVLTVEDNGHTIKVSYDEGSSIEVNGTAYNLLQYHFHALSENTIAETHADLEMHLVHQSDAGEYAVVGVMMNRGAENAALNTVWSNLPATSGEAMTISAVTINASDLLPTAQSYYRFAGSFTTPPCTEGVNWFVMTDSIEISDAQALVFEQLYSNNYRPVQPLNDRNFFLSVEATPQTLPESGEVAALPIASIMVGIGGLMTAVGLFFGRRKWLNK